MLNGLKASAFICITGVMWADFKALYICKSVTFSPRAARVSDLMECLAFTLVTQTTTNIGPKFRRKNRYRVLLIVGTHGWLIISNGERNEVESTMDSDNGFCYVLVRWRIEEHTSSSIPYNFGLLVT